MGQWNEWNETEWADEWNDPEWADEWNDAEWADEWAEDEWDEQEWAEWQASSESAPAPETVSKGKRKKVKGAVPEEAEVPKQGAKAKAQPKARAVGRARKVTTAIVPDDGEDDFDYPLTFARRACPPHAHSESWVIWRAIVKTFWLHILPHLDPRTRTTSEAGAGVVFNSISDCVANDVHGFLWCVQAGYYLYARARWLENEVCPGDADFFETMTMAAQEFVVLRPTLAEVPNLHNWLVQS